MRGNLKSGDRAKVTGDTGNPETPIGTEVFVHEVHDGFGPGPRTVSVSIRGKGNIVSHGIREDLLEKIG